MGTKSSVGDPWKIYIKPNAPTNLAIDVKITYADGTYSKVEWFKVTINVDYINIAVNDIATTVTSNGSIGYRDDGQVGGLGFSYKGAGSVLYEAGLMVARDSSVSDRFRGMNATGDKDFSSVKNASKILPAVQSDFDVEVTIKDNLALNPLPIQIHQKAFAWSTAPFRKFVIVEYVIYNKGTSTLSNLYAGIGADWDIDGTTFKDNRAEFDATNKMGYCYYTGTNGTYAGVKLLTKNAPVNQYAIDNGSGFTGVDMSDGFSGDEKFTTLSTARTIAGQAGTGNDVLQVVSTGPFSVNSNDSIVIAFALIAGDDLSDMQSSAGNAQIKYDALYPNGINDAIAGVNNVRVFPNPTAGTSNVQIDLENTSMVELALYNVLGEKLTTLTSEKLQNGIHQFSYDTNNLASGVYYYNLTVNGSSKTIKFIVSK
jgi:hypothetical protein